MGNQQSSADIVNDVLNKTVTNVLIENSQNCSQNNTSVQDMSFNDISADEGCSINFSGISQTALVAPNFTCSSKQENNSELMNKLQTALGSEAESKLSGLAGALNSESRTTIKNKIVNEITNNINMSNVSSCVQDNLSKQKLQFKKIVASCPSYCRNVRQCKGVENMCDMSQCKINFTDINQSLTNKAVASCMSANENVQKIVNDVANDVTSSAKASNTGIDITMSYGVSIVCSFVCLSIIIAIFAFLNSSAGQQMIDKAPSSSSS